MHRIDTKTAQKDKFGAGKNGFTRGNPQTGTPATDLDDDYFDMLQEELCSVVEASGASLEKARHDQLLTALRALLLSRKNPFGDIKSDGTVKTALENLGISNAVIGDGVNVIGFSRNDATKPYMRHAQSDSVVALATASQLIGTDQTYQIVTDKYPGITYTNTSKQPWVISLKVNLPASGEVQIKVNGVMAAGGNTPNYAGVSSWVYPCAIVPPGANYMVELSFGNVIEWIELK